MSAPDHSSTSLSSRIASASEPSVPEPSVPEPTTIGTTVDKHPTLSPKYPARILVTVQTTQTSTWLREYTHSTILMLFNAGVARRCGCYYCRIQKYYGCSCYSCRMRNLYQPMNGAMRSHFF